jgi:hypothetical protein
MLFLRLIVMVADALYAPPRWNVLVGPMSCHMQPKKLNVERPLAHRKGFGSSANPMGPFGTAQLHL